MSKRISVVKLTKKKVSVFILLFLIAVSSGRAATYYVDQNHPSASDSNPGTENLPWLTIQHAADVVVAGDTVYVKEGVYNERVVPQNSGEPGRKIVFKALPRRSVTMWGFYTVNCNYLRIEGFNITTDTSLTGWTEGPGVFIRSDYVEVVDNYFFYPDSLGRVAIIGYWGLPYSKGCYIANNKIYRAKMGIVVYGDNWLIENNEIERLVNYGSGDSDYSRFFGDSIIFRNNYFHGTLLSEIADAHVDGFQTFNNNGEYVNNVIIEGNIVESFHQGVIAQNNIEPITISNITIKNNVFIGGDIGGSWGAVFHNVPDVYIYNNVFANLLYHGVGIRDSSSAVVKNNIFYNAGSNYWADTTSTVEGGYNILNTGVPYDSLDILADPLFINPGNFLGPDSIPFTDDDGFALQDSSPAIDAGIGLPGIVDYDILGVPRPQGDGWDIGAYEYVPVKIKEISSKNPNYELLMIPGIWRGSLPIQYILPEKSKVNIAIYNVSGQRIKTLISKPQNPGTHHIIWKSRASGVYFIKFKASKFERTKKILIIK